MSHTLCGVEVELALGLRPSRHSHGAPMLYQFLLARLIQMAPALPSKKCGLNRGLMLGQGSKMLMDGPFLEPATPEVCRSEEANAYQRAGERLILEALPRAAKAVGNQPKLIPQASAVSAYSGEKAKPVARIGRSSRERSAPRYERGALLRDSRSIIFDRSRVRRRRS